MQNPIAWIQNEWTIRQVYRLVRHGRAEQALDKLEKRLLTRPDDADLLLQKAWCLADVKRWEESLALADEVLKHHPRHAVFHLLRGEVLFSLERYEEAKQALLESLHLSGENIRVEYSLGLVFVALGDMERAAQYFESSVRYDRTLVQSRLLAMAESYLLEEKQRKSSVS